MVIYHELSWFFNDFSVIGSRFFWAILWKKEKCLDLRKMLDPIVSGVFSMDDLF